MKTALTTKRSTGRAVRDCIFLLAAVFLALYYFRLSGRGVNVCDEWSFIVAARRMINGDVPLLHDRTPVIFSCFFLCPPVRLFYALTGSYTGVILFIRRLYVVCHLIFSSVIYARLRKYDWFALFAAINYMCFVPNEMYSLYYNSISLMAVVTVCLLLFTGRAPGRIRLVLAGAAAACAVLALPHVAFIYFLWSIAVFAVYFFRRGNSEKLSALPVYFSVKGWLYVTLGIAVCAAAVIAGLLSRASFGALIGCLPDFLEYANYTSGSVFGVPRLMSVLRMFGYAPPFFAVLLIAAAAADRKRSRRRILYLSLCAALLAAMYISLYAYYFSDNVTRTNFLSVNMRSMPFYVAGILAYVLSEKKDRDMLSFLILCLAFSLARDCSSNVVVGLGAPGADIASAILLRGLLKEITSEKAADDVRGRTKRLTAAVLAVPLCLALLSETVWKVAGRNFSIIESSVGMNTAPLTNEIENGPMRGIKTTVKGKYVYQDILKDLDRIRPDAGSVYIAGKFQYGYLYLDSECPADSTVFDTDKTEPFLLPYWEQFPEKRPDCIYVPFYDCESCLMIKDTAAELISVFRKSYSFTVTDGVAGYILTNVQKT